MTTFGNIQTQRLVRIVCLCRMLHHLLHWGHVRRYGVHHERCCSKKHRTIVSPGSPAWGNGIVVKAIRLRH
jgi:hypothetical protein